MNTQIEWCLTQHRETNHFYDTYLPYEFHLRMVVQVCGKFKVLMADSPTFEVLELACWGHDLIEDTRVSYNDCKEVLGEDVANIIYAVSNEKGKNRKERANDKYYEGIRNTKGAEFVKLCDRIANVQYSKMMGSKMFDMYRKENGNFMKQIDGNNPHLNKMYSYLISLFD